jgi:hypothetical protein
MKQVQIFGLGVNTDTGQTIGTGIASTDLTSSFGGISQMGTHVNQALVTASANVLFTGTQGVFFIASELSSVNVAPGQNKRGIQSVEHCGHWSQSHEPAVTVLGTTTKAASGGITHVCTGFSGSLVAVAAIAAPLYLRIRNGASGLGTILWSMAFTAPAGTCINYALSGLSLVNTEGNALTCEWSAAPGATNFQAVSLTGFSINSL